MFGLEFPVRAGRCTRGVFMRLLPVPTGDFPYDYILVVDTEGLRAPELGMLKYDHDNELATFVIGIGDITLINIKGENTRGSRCFANRSSCLYEIDSAGCVVPPRPLVRRPPMAPSNPGYSKIVYELRCKVLSDKTKRTSNLTLAETSQRIHDLWKGILSEDFIFSFRNSLEIKAYIRVERKFSELSSQMRAFVFSYFQNKIKGKLAICNTEQELELACNESKQRIRKHVECELENKKRN
ncbi:unnamed protein product [Mytilus edulis]|uniref:VLIG-type G domain-containing protein n=1 Tax=Mytilus edulis TaxID=6550 RepID=A0A8S3R4L9_MYTED|nr:unnamed protein product [Mytilus edulis]